MSETPTPPEDKKPEDKKLKESDFEKETKKGPVSPVNEDLYEFLSALFGGEGEFPEKLECRTLVGRNKATYGDVIWQKIFKGVSKPNEQQVVNLANQALHRMRVHTDMRQRECYFLIGAIHHDRSDDYYEVMHFTVKPGKKWKNGERGDAERDDEDDEFSPGQYNRHFLDHIRDREGTILGMVEGLIDRSDRQAQTAQNNFERIMSKYIELLEINLKLVQAGDERQERIEKAKMWRENINKGLDMAWSMVPPLLAGFKKGDGGWQQGMDSPEAKTLRDFFREKKEGGPFSREQFEVIMGRQDEEGNLIPSGVLSEDQVLLLVGLAKCEINPSQVDLLLPGAKLAITQDQIMKIMASGIPQEAFAPIYALIQVRMAKREEAKKQLG